MGGACTACVVLGGARQHARRDKEWPMRVVRDARALGQQTVAMARVAPVCAPRSCAGAPQCRPPRTAMPRPVELRRPSRAANASANPTSVACRNRSRRPHPARTARWCVPTKWSLRWSTAPGLSTTLGTKPRSTRRGASSAAPRPQARKMAAAPRRRPLRCKRRARRPRDRTFAWTLHCHAAPVGGGATPCRQ